MTILLEQFEKSLNRTLALDSELFARLKSFTGKVIALELLNTALTLYLKPSITGINVTHEYQGPVHVRIRGTPMDLLSYMIAAGAGGEGFGTTLEIIGDVGLAQRFQSVMKGVELDWEEQISHWIGDSAARKAGNLLRDSARFVKQAGNSLKQNLSEYLRYEKEVLPDQYDVDDFTGEVDALRDAVERLKARINRLDRKIEELR